MIAANSAVYAIQDAGSEGIITVVIITILAIIIIFVFLKRKKP